MRSPSVARVLCYFALALLAWHDPAHHVIYLAIAVSYMMETDEE
jgi:hypothetical protein